MNDQSPQLGLLDLSVDLSVPEVYSGTDFTVYLHIKNPFAIPVWVRSVELSLPTQLEWRIADDNTGWLRAWGVKWRNWKIRKLRNELRRLPEGDASDARRREIEATIRDLIGDNTTIEELLGSEGRANVHVDDGSAVHFYGSRLSDLNLYVDGGSAVHVYGGRSRDEPERVPLVGSLPKNAALEPGCTDVWTIRLGTGKSPFFQPAKYHLQLTVVYGTERPQNIEPGTRVEPTQAERDDSAQRIYSNTTSFTVGVKAALWNVMLGGVVGGAVGSVARSLHDAKTLPALVDPATRGTAIGALLLAVILSGAAIVFAARKSDAQSFVTVEDFWGGVLIGFLIGYSGTAAFSDITRMNIIDTPS